MYLSTAPYLSFAGAHLPRLKVPVPLHLLVGRGSPSHLPLARPPRGLDAARAGRRELVHQGGAAQRRASTTICSSSSASSGSAARSPAPASDRREELHVTSTFRNLPGPFPRWLRDSPLTQDIVIGNMEYVLGHGAAGARALRINRSPWPSTSTASTIATPDALVSPRLRTGRRRGEPAALGLAVSAEPEQSGRRAADLGGARGPRDHRPVRDDAGGLSVKGASGGSWGMDVMVAPERQRQGLGEVLFRTWDRHVGASLGLGLSDSSHRLFRKLRWPEVGPGPVPGQAADAPRVRHPDVAGAGQPPRLGGDAADRAVHRAHAAAERRSAADPPLRRAFTRSGSGWRRSSTSRSAATPRT